MDSFTPLFGKIVESSLWHEDPKVCKVFITMLAVKDYDHIVRKNAFGLADCSKLTEVEVIEALEVLSNPDRKRIEPQAHDGRRIKKVPEGYLILNGSEYQDLMRAVMRRAYLAQKQRESRARKAAQAAEAPPSPWHSVRGNADPGGEEPPSV